MEMYFGVYRFLMQFPGWRRLPAVTYTLWVEVEPASWPDPPDIEPNDLPRHLRYVLDNIEENVWFKILGSGYQTLTAALGNKFPIVQRLYGARVI